MIMISRGPVAAILLLAALGISAGARAQDQSQLPAWRGQWVRVGGGAFDPTKPSGRGQEAPLIPAYQAILEASIADQATGGQGNDPMGSCTPPGMPRTMIDYDGMEIVVTPDTTYVVLEEPMVQVRRIYTDGRAWPQTPTPSFLGYSIGKWIDTDGNGRFDVLEVETRAIKLPHVYDSSGAPFHQDGEAVVKERIYADKADPQLLHNEITVLDHALTAPRAVTRSYRRAPRATWFEMICNLDNHQVRVGKERYYVSGDGYLMPTRKDQQAPGLQGFDQSAN
jgi:hypothetical protein